MAFFQSYSEPQYQRDSSMHQYQIPQWEQQQPEDQGSQMPQQDLNQPSPLTPFHDPPLFVNTDPSSYAPHHRSPLEESLLFHGLNSAGASSRSARATFFLPRKNDVRTVSPSPARATAHNFAPTPVASEALIRTAVQKTTQAPAAIRVTRPSLSMTSKSSSIFPRRRRLRPDRTLSLSYSPVTDPPKVRGYAQTQP